MANVIGLAGAACIGIGGYILFYYMGCRSVDVPQCEGVTDAGWWLLPVGLTIAILAAFASAGIVFLSIFVAIGAAALIAGLQVPGDGGGTFVTIGAVFLGVVALLLLGLLWLANKQKHLRKIVKEGVKSLATVVAVRDTGVTINNNPRVEVTVRIEPMDGRESFEASKAITFPRVALPRPGMVYAAWYLPEDPNNFALGEPDGSSTHNADAATMDLLNKVKKANIRGAAVGGFSGSMPPPAPGVDSTDTVQALAKLHELHAAGALSDQEYQQAKDKLLGS